MTRIVHLNDPHAPQALEAHTSKKDVATLTTASEKRQRSSNNEARREERRGQ